MLAPRARERWWDQRGVHIHRSMAYFICTKLTFYNHCYSETPEPVFHSFFLRSLCVCVCVYFRVTFQFKSSKRSNNGTDVGSGQIPELLYRLPELESEEGEELQLLGQEFSSTVSPVSIGAEAERERERERERE